MVMARGAGMRQTPNGAMTHAWHMSIWVMAQPVDSAYLTGIACPCRIHAWRVETSSHQHE